MRIVDDVVGELLFGQAGTIPGSQAFVQLIGGVPKEFILSFEDGTWGVIGELVDNMEGGWKQDTYETFGSPPAETVDLSLQFTIQWRGGLDNFRRTPLYERTLMGSGPTVPWTAVPPRLFLSNRIIRGRRSGGWTNPTPRSLWSPTGVGADPVLWQLPGTVGPR